MNLHRVVAGESWKTFFAVVFGTWMVLWLFASLHNQYLIRIAPEHFTVWHYRIPFTQDYTLLGICYAFGATASPGLVLGVCLFVAGRMFDRPKLSIAQILFSLSWVWLAVEICSLALGWRAWSTGREVYWDWAYPDDSRGLITTQTIQLTAYLSGMFFSLLLIYCTWARRKPRVGA